MNKLYYGDNLTIMKEMPNENVDLIYLDPPFNSNRGYNLLYKNTNPKMLTYLVYMTVRLVEMHRLLKPDCIRSIPIFT